MDRNKFNPKEYWNQRLASHTDLQGTGHRAFNLEYNLFLYRAQEDRLTEILAKRAISLVGKRILDVGSGTGFFVGYYLENGAENIVGVDIAESSVKYLKSHFPKCVFYVEDISTADLSYLETFDFISAISVLYHIVDDALFAQAVTNLCQRCNPGGYLLFSDVFQPSFMISAKHARLRTLEAYRSILDPLGFEILEQKPIYYLLNRSFIPFIGPKIISLLKLGPVFYRLDHQFGRRGWKNGDGMKFMLARRRSG